MREMRGWAKKHKTGGGVEVFKCSDDGAAAPRLGVELEHVRVGRAVVRDAALERRVVHAVEVATRRVAPPHPAERVERGRRVDHEVARVRAPALAQQVHERVGTRHRALSGHVLAALWLDPPHELQPERVARPRVHEPASTLKILLMEWYH